MACHYKLDPMAGYFRNIGAGYNDFSNERFIIFDDGAKVEREPYLENWRAPAGSSREWNVGYVRSTTDERLNDYGDGIEDLHRLLRRAPEVKRCVVRRLFEYLVAEEQPIDGSYLDYLTNEFSRRAQTNSAEAFKWTVGQLLLSNSYQQPDMQATQCYDFGPGYDPTGAPPCQVGYILHKNCATCHSSTAGAGRLNLDSWTVMADGKMAFPHLDGSGQQRTLKETLERIIQRLSAADPYERMPLFTYMSAQERQQLFVWAQRMLNEQGIK